MAPLIFADTHNMVVFLSKSDASAGFDQIVDFLNIQVSHYALMVNPTIYVSCIKQFWATTSIKKVNDVVKLKALIDRKKVVDVVEEEDEEDEVHAAPTPLSPIHAPSPPPYEPITTPPQAQPAPPSSPPQEQPTDTSMALLHTLMKTCATLRMHPSRGRIEAIDADEDITLVDMETKVDLDAELQGRLERKDDDNITATEVNVAELTVFDDEEVTMTMAQTLIKMKAKNKESLMSKWLKGCMMRNRPPNRAQQRSIMCTYLKNMEGWKLKILKNKSFHNIQELFDKAMKKAELVPELWVFDKLNFTVTLFDEKLLPDPAFLCGF
nr:hypothetical protein [Tanacetum cinerariifolium]